MNKAVNQISLYEAKPRCAYVTRSAPDIAQLESIGIREGTRVRVRNRYALGGPVLLRVEDAYTVAVGKDIAKRISVAEDRPVTNDTGADDAGIKNGEAA